MSSRYSLRPHGRSFAIALVVGLLAPALAACGSSSSSSSPTTAAGGTSGTTGSPATTGSPGTAATASETGVTLHIGDQEQKTQTLMEAAGQLSNLPYKVSWADFTSGPPELQALEAGSLSLASSVGDTPPLFANAAGGGGADLRVVAAFQSDRQDTNAILVPKSSTITSVAQLKGKKVAVTTASSGHLTLLLALQKAGLSWKDITPVDLQPAQAEAAFTDGSIAAWAVWYPFVSVALAQGAKVVTTGKGLDPGYSYLLSDKKAIANSGESAAIGNFIKRLDVSEQWAAKHQKEWASKFATISQLPSAEALATVQNSLATGVRINAALWAQEQKQADAFTAAGFIKKINVKTFTLGTYNMDVPSS
jgi:sulfonate transport system substrate-binding protein